MQVLLSTIGSRGDVQPIVALGAALKALGQAVRVCAPPDFRVQIEQVGLAFTPLGPALRATGKANPSAAPPTAEERRRMVEASFAAQLESVTAAAQGCDLIVVGGYLVLAARTVAETLRVPYVMAAYCPAFLPSPHHAPPVYPMLGQRPADGTVDHLTLWAEDARRWNETWRAIVNSHRDAAGLEPVSDVRTYLFTDEPWLAADAALAPWPVPSELRVAQTGAWIVSDERPLSEELEAFLDDGEPPVYFGFGSVRAPVGLAQTMIDAARSVGQRAILSRGWADLAVHDARSDCMSIGEVNHQALFPRVAAVVHHGGAGTTTAAARAGAPHVVIPQHTDQHYWALRVENLGVGVAHAPGSPTTASLASALERALRPDVQRTAAAVAKTVRGDGAKVAAERLIATYARANRG